MIHEEIMEKYSTLSNKELKEEITILKEEICWQMYQNVYVDRKTDFHIRDRFEFIRLTDQMLEISAVLENRRKKRGRGL